MSLAKVLLKQFGQFTHRVITKEGSTRLLLTRQYPGAICTMVIDSPALDGFDVYNSPECTRDSPEFARDSPGYGLVITDGFMTLRHCITFTEVQFASNSLIKATELTNYISDIESTMHDFANNKVTSGGWTSPEYTQDGDIGPTVLDLSIPTSSGRIYDVIIAMINNKRFEVRGWIHHIASLKYF